MTVARVFTSAGWVDLTGPTGAQGPPGPSGSGSSVGTLAARPAANSVVSGYHYFASDQVVDYISDGTNWIRTGLPAGVTVDWFKPDAAVPTGWVLYDGGTLPASTGIYADLYAHLGNTTTKPDTRGRVTSGVGTHSEVASVGLNDGLAVATRAPKHNSTNGLTFNGSGGNTGTVSADHTHSGTTAGRNAAHVHGPQTIVNRSGGVDSFGFGGSGFSLFNDNTGTESADHAHAFQTGGISANHTHAFTPAGTIGGTVGPGGTRPTDGAAYIVCAKIAKL